MVKKDKLTLPVADMGENNPLPDIRNVSYIHAGFEVKPSLSEEEREHLGKGLIDTILPYTIQNGYTRDKKVKAIDIVVLENEYLRAEFLPSFGARLWSLYDKKIGRELLFKNPVIQPCNFAIRNAWLAGGIEFNIGIKGHSPLTCEPMFCEFIGDSAVRFYEYERIRGLAYGITAYLPEKSETLYVRTNVENRSDNPTYMYWWTNIATPETKDTRVIAPANDAIHCLYQEDHYALDKASIPFDGGVDVTYSLNMKSSSDYFYKIPKESKKWEATTDKNGYGFFEYSTDMLKSRKLFLWGNAAGGRHWNEFLSKKGMAYIEIQAGLMNTQLEHILMPANTEWSWTQGFTSLDGTDPAFYGEWNGAQKAVLSQFEAKLKRGATVDFDALSSLAMDGKKTLVFNGKSWGALENKLREKSGERKISNSFEFPLVQDSETEEWRKLLDSGRLPTADLVRGPLSYVTGEKWTKALEYSIEKYGADWYSLLHLGVAKYAAKDLKKAEECWLASVAQTENFWAYRNLSALYKNEYKDMKKAVEYADKAIAMAGADKNIFLLREYAALLIENGDYDKYVKKYFLLPKKTQRDGRLIIYLAFAYLGLDEPYKAKELISPDFVLCDVKEGELSVSGLWSAIYTAIVEKEEGLDKAKAKKVATQKYPLPAALDFRMHD